MRQLENELRPELHCPWITHPSHRPESRRSGEGKRQGGEVCVVENIEHFATELQPRPLAKKRLPETPPNVY